MMYEITSITEGCCGGLNCLPYETEFECPVCPGMGRTPSHAAEMTGYYPDDWLSTHTKRGTGAFFTCERCGQLFRLLAPLALLAGALLLAPSPAKASGTTAAQPETTLDMARQASRTLAIDDADMNRAYKSLQSFLDPQGKALLIQAERAWIAYRDTECKFAIDVNRGGTIQEIEYPSCLDRLTIQHLKELEHLRTAYEDR